MAVLGWSVGWRDGTSVVQNILVENSTKKQLWIRPRQQWLDGVIKDVKEIDNTIQMEKSRIPDRWTSLVEVRLSPLWCVDTKKQLLHIRLFIVYLIKLKNCFPNFFS